MGLAGERFSIIAWAGTMGALSRALKIGFGLCFCEKTSRRLAGRSDVEPRIESAVLGCDLPENDERADYLRATLTPGPDGPVATPFAQQDSSMLVPLAKAGCLLVREPHEAAARAGSRCNILKLGL